MTDDDIGPAVVELQATLADKAAYISELEAALKRPKSRISAQRERVDKREAEFLSKDRCIEAMETANEQLLDRLTGAEDHHIHHNDTRWRASDA